VIRSDTVKRFITCIIKFTIMPQNTGSFFFSIILSSQFLHSVLLTLLVYLTSVWPCWFIWPLFDLVSLSDLYLTLCVYLTSIWRCWSIWPLFDLVVDPLRDNSKNDPLLHSGCWPLFHFVGLSDLYLNLLVYLTSIWPSKSIWPLFDLVDLSDLC
jgi:hypothetical protein